MNMDVNLEQMFGLEPEHSLVLSSQRRVKRDSTVYETRWLDERDEEKKLIARFRTWTNQALKPPYRKQLGWERYSPTGELLVREVRYSKRDDEEYVH